MTAWTTHLSTKSFAPASNLYPYIAYSPLELAKEKTEGEISLNQTCLVKTSGAVGGKQAIFICAPLKENGDNALVDCYQKIFKTAYENGATTVLVPAFNTEPDIGYDPDVAAEIAIKEASTFLEDHPQFSITFVVYRSSENGHTDERNAKAYLKTLNQFCPEGKAQLSCVYGEIQFLDADMIIIPIAKNFSETGIVCHAVETASQLSASERPMMSCEYLIEAEHTNAEREEGNAKCILQNHLSSLNEKEHTVVDELLNYHLAYYSVFSQKDEILYSITGYYPGCIAQTSVKRDKNSQWRCCNPLNTLKISQGIIAKISLETTSFISKQITNMDPLLILPRKSLNYKCAVETQFLSKGKVIEQKYDPLESFLNGGINQRLINISLLLDVYIPYVTEKIIDLRDSIVAQKNNFHNKVYFPQMMSPMVIVAMMLSKKFFVPTFMKGYTTMPDHKQPNSPVSNFKCNSLEKQNSRPFNVVLEVDMDGQPIAFDTNFEVCLLPCYTQLEYIGQRMEEGHMVIELKVAKENSEIQTYYLGTKFLDFATDRYKCIMNVWQESHYITETINTLTKSISQFKNQMDQENETVTNEIKKNQLKENIEKIELILQSSMNYDKTKSKELLFESLKIMNDLRNPSESQIKSLNELIPVLYTFTGTTSEHIKEFRSQLEQGKMYPQITKLFIYELFGHDFGANMDHYKRNLISLLWLSIEKDDADLDEDICGFLQMMYNWQGSKADLKEELGITDIAQIRAMLLKALTP